MRVISKQRIMILDIILIGPYWIGKAENASLLSERLGIQNKSLDDLVYNYCQELLSCDATEAGRHDLDDPWWQPSCRHAVKRFLSDLELVRCVMDFGAHHSVYDGDLFTEMQQVLSYYNVILLTPSPDPEESIRILTERYAQHWHKSKQPH